MEFTHDPCRCEHQEEHHDEHRRENDRCRAISDLIKSVAEEQEALARILDAEHEKIEKASELCRTDVDDLIRIDKSVERVLAAVTRLDLALQLKLDLFHDCLCHDEHCRRDHHKD